MGVRRVLIAGAGLAGLRAAESLRRFGYDGEIVVVGEEARAPYTRPPLSKEMLTGPFDPEALSLPHRSDPSIQWRLGVQISRVRGDLGVLHLADGEELEMSGLVVATGVRARRLLPQDAGAYVVRTVEDAHSLAAALAPGRRVLVLGAGFLGCEIATSATSRGCDVTVVEPLEEPLAAALGTDVGAALRRRHMERGVAFHLGRRVAEVRRTQGDAILDDATVVGFDVLVEAVGGRPDLAWLDGAPLDLTDGVLCDASLRAVLTSQRPAVPVVAAGDVARFPLPRFGSTPRRIEHWNLAVDSAGLAAHTLLTAMGEPTSRPAPPEPAPSFWSDQAGVRLDCFGIPTLGLADVRVLAGNLGEEAAVGYYDAIGRLVAVVLVGLRHEAGRCRRLMANGPVAAEAAAAYWADTSLVKGEQ